MPKFFRKTVRFAFIAAISVMTCWSTLVWAQENSQDELDSSKLDPVLVFNRVCYSQVPSITKIRDMATRFAWEKMGGDDLLQFTTWENPEVLEGWDVSLFGRIYRLGLVQGEPTKEMKKEFPDFAAGKATVCTLVLDGTDDEETINTRMTTLAGKKPSRENIDEGVFTTQLWAGGNDDFKIFLFSKSDQSDKASLLSVTVLAKE